MARSVFGNCELLFEAAMADLIATSNKPGSHSRSLCVVFGGSAYTGADVKTPGISTMIVSLR
jgi:hypothetical protein